MMYLAQKGYKKLRSKGGDGNKLYVTKLKATALWFFYKEVTGIKSNIVKKYDLIDNNPETLKATNEDSIVQHIREKNIEINMEATMTVGEIDKDNTEVE